MSRARAPSLVATLFGRIGALFVVIVVVVGAATFFIAQRRINEVYDGQLIIAANVMRALMGEELAVSARGPGGRNELDIDDAPLLSAEDRAAFNAYAEWRMFRIWRDGRLVLRSDTGPLVAASPVTEGFSEVVGPKDHWRIYTLVDPRQRVAVQVGERTDIRLVIVRDIAVGLALPLLVLLPLAAGLIWVALRGGLKAMRALFGEVGRRSGRDLSPLPFEPWPRDLYPLIRSINALLERIGRSLRQERRFLDDAAHQLRTPLAAVKLQAQMIAEEPDPAERQALIAQLSGGVDRAAAMTDALLTLASLEARTDPGEGGDLKAEVVAAIADLAPLAARRDISLAFEGGPAPVRGEPMLLRLIAANLLENAIEHAPDGSEVSVRLWCDGARRYLSVTDSGPGIAEAERGQVVERFYRGRNTTSKGSGLGLSIVTEALRLLGGRLVLSDRPDRSGGLQATVELPQVAA